MRWIFVLLATLLACCSGSYRHVVIRIGIDPTWSPLDFGEQQSYVNGYVEDLLLEIARSSPLEFEKISANWDSLTDGLMQGRYDAILSSIPPHTFNLAKWDFSNNFLDIGPVLITPQKGIFTKLDELAGKAVGVLADDPAITLLGKIPKIVIRLFDSIPEMLGATSSGQVEAAVLDRLRAVSYTKDLYAGQLKIASPPLTNAGLHAIAAKKSPDPFIRAWNSALEELERQKKIEALQGKWGLL